MIEGERSHTCLPAGRECTEQKREFPACSRPIGRAGRSVFSRKALSEKKGIAGKTMVMKEVPERPSDQINQPNSCLTAGRRLMRTSFTILQVVKRLYLRGHTCLPAGREREGRGCSVSFLSL
jgi:hypothetical protein